MSDQGLSPIAPPSQPISPSVSTAQSPVPLPTPPAPQTPTQAPKPKASPKKAAAPAKPPAAKKAASPAKKAAAKKTVQTTVSCDEALMDRIKARAEEEERTLSVVIGRLLRSAMEGWPPEGDSA